MSTYKSTSKSTSKSAPRSTRKSALNSTFTRGDSSLALEAIDLTVVLGGQKIVDVPEFFVNANEVMMIIGPNGSGKSTLLLSLALLLKKQTGTIRYKGVPVHTSTEILAQRRRLAAVLQEPLLLNSSVSHCRPPCRCPSKGPRRIFCAARRAIRAVRCCRVSWCGASCSSR